MDREAVVIRWGLCCQFVDSPIKFRAATHGYVATLTPKNRRWYLADIADHNALALVSAVERCHELGIGAFRITSGLFPLATHPLSGYTLAQLDPSGGVTGTLAFAGALGEAYDIRLSLHPDQFIVLNSEREPVVQSAVRELELHGEVAELVGADVIVLHGGGAIGGATAALERLERGMALLTPRTRERLALENDDRCFTPRDLLPLCERTGVPLVYDVHHHRCLPDGLTELEATDRSFATWRTREPYTHLSSPKEGWGGPNVRAHADYIDPNDFPEIWLDRTLTIDVEAKAKERAVLALKAAVASRESGAYGLQVLTPDS